MQKPVECAAILAGGLSSRMGHEKALLAFEGKPLIVRTAQTLNPLFKQIVVVTANAEVAATAQLPSVTDQFAGRGPLGGIHAALQHFQAPTFVVACDMPFLNRGFIQLMSTSFFESETALDAIVPHSENGSEPLHAIYSPTCLPVLERFLQGSTSGKTPSLRKVLSQMSTKFIPEQVAQSFSVRFENWNTPDDIGTSN